MSDRMGPLDAAFLHLEDDTTHLHIGSCAIFEGPPPPYEEIVGLIAAKLPRLPRYRQKVRFVPGGLGHPVWIDDPHFNLRYHVRHTALPPPGADTDLRNLMGRVMSQPLDRHRPLWEAWVVEGLRDGCWALLSKVHHCMVDGVAGNDLITVLLDTERHPPEIRSPRWSARPEPSGLRLAVEALAGRAVDPARELGRVARLARTPSSSATDIRAAASGLVALGRRLAPTGAMSVTGRIGPHRRWDWATIDLADVATIRAAFGGTVNDVAVAVVSAGFRTLLQSRGDPVERLVVRALIPVSVRGLLDRRTGNQVSAMIAELPVAVVDPIDRLREVSRQLARLKASHQSSAGQALTHLAALAPPRLLTAGLRSVSAIARHVPQRSVHTVVTNVPGPRQPLYAAGREMLEYLPFVPIAPGARIGVAVVSYRGRLAFGVTGDWDSAPDIDRLCRGIAEGVAELVRRAREEQPTDGNGVGRRSDIAPQR